jgi:plastocyanin
MRLLSLAAIGGLATSALAVADHWQMASVMCSGEKTITVTVTAGAAGAAPAPGPYSTPPPIQKQGYEAQPQNGYGSSYITTAGGTVTSVDYNMKTTSTYCPSAGTYKNPYWAGQSLTVGKATWTTLEYPQSTVYNYPPGGFNKLATKVIYEDRRVIQLIVVGINVQVVNGVTSSSFLIKTDRPTYTPPLPPPYSPTSSASSAAKTHYVDVGIFEGKVQFVPDSVDAEIGDIVLYNFLAKSHSVTQSNFNTPCTFNGGFDTGLNQPNPENQTDLFLIPFTVSTKTPLWFYCKQPGPPNHCGQGMVFGINPAGKMDQFVQNAIKQNGALQASSLATTATSTTTSASTTTMSTSTVIPTVTVGEGDGTVLKFDPPFLQNIAPGQHVHFDFRALNHTLTESSFDDPCSKLPGTTIDTNFMNANKADTPEAKPFDLWINTAVPRYFYCKQANGTPNSHCGKGMVFAVNIDQDRFDDFVKNAEETLPK